MTLMCLVTTAEEKVHIKWLEYVVNPNKPLKQRVYLFQNVFFCNGLRQQMLDREMDTR